MLKSQKHRKTDLSERKARFVGNTSLILIYPNNGLNTGLGNYLVHCPKLDILILIITTALAIENLR